MTILVASISVALLVSALCSLLEAALLSLTPSQLAQMHAKFPKASESCRHLKQDIGKPLAVILITNTAAHTIGAAVAGAEFGELFGARWLGVFSLAFTLVMIQYTELLPKTVGVRFNQTVMSVASMPLSVMVVVMTPLINLTRWLNWPFERHTARHKPSTVDEIAALAAMARSSQQISTRQERIINAVPLLSQRTAEQVMLPVENISFMSTEQRLTDALNWSVNDFHTRYPVCENGDRNKVAGYVNFKEVVAAYRTNPDRGTLRDIMRPISFASPSESGSLLLERFVTQHCHMAIIRDEKTGKTLGLVTLEDVVEELLGDLDDEFDPLPRTFYSPSEGIWIVGGGLPMTLLGRETRMPLPKRTEPVAVWFARMLKRPIRVGDVYRAGNAEFFVRKLRRGRVVEFMLKKMIAQG